MSKEKERLDLLLVQQGLFPSRERARGAIMAGLVFVDGQREDKPGSRFPLDAAVEVRGDDLPYVSRGGLKLEQAMRQLGFDPKGKVILDVGASTGGFTDCALQHGALKVYAVDVGYNQLAWRLRQDPRVHVLERTNVRYLTAEQVPELVDGVTIDVSFISLRLALPPAVRLLRSGGDLVALIKPQFEAGREQVGKRGVVREMSVHRQVIEQVLEYATEQGLALLGLTYSPITGPEGNIEFLGRWQKADAQTPADARQVDVQALVQAAHEALGNGKNRH
ncbi:MAG: TlyA family RNA methyltransferase [Bacillota bacterium]|jgi:23S rRNA (cytidine1920-2'-O)/16S rRNA (cytidine1409-2'-O)-methyltransferase